MPTYSFLNGKPVLLVVLGYGCHLTTEIQDVLNKVALLANKSSMNVKEIFATGGYTNHKSAPGVSEARIIKEFLSKQVTIPIEIEESAITSEDNIKAVKSFIEKGTLGSKSLEDINLIIFCDKLHRNKISNMMKEIFHKDAEFAILGLRIIEPTLKNRLIQFVARYLDVWAMGIPWLKKKQLERKKRIMAVS